MRHWISAILVGLLRITTVAAQQNPFQVAGQLFADREGRLDYVAPLRALAINQPSFDSDVYRQALATYNSFVGKLSPTAPTKSATPYALAEVGPLLARRARATSVVLINEAHNQPAHRAYCRQLLMRLAPLGYSILAVEALSTAEININERKFPVSASGFYTREPNMANLLRAACESGFYVFSHEQTAVQNKKFTDSGRADNYRDSMQAVNILAMLRRNPKAKIVALVGYDHVLEKKRNGLKRMATYLRELGHLDPFTIDQTETYQPQLSGPATQPMALIARDGTLTTIGDRKGYVDMQIIHPVVTLVQGRPRWLVEGSSAVLFVRQIPPTKVGHFWLVQLYDQKEYRQYGEKAIPLDQYLTGPKEKQVQLVGFKPGRAVITKYRAADLL